MDKNIHRYLDGELRREELTPSQLQELTKYEDLIRETREAHLSIEVPDLTARVMARIPQDLANPSPPRGLRAVASWIWSPRAVVFRPAYGILASAALFLLLIGLGRDPLPIEPSAPAKVFVQFRLDAPRASKVELAGSFTEWQPAYALEEVVPGVWSVLIPLDPGVHNYMFIVDDREWITDSSAPVVTDGFGGVNNRLSVLLPNGSSHL
jgi:hypothetical protein